MGFIEKYRAPQENHQYGNPNGQKMTAPKNVLVLSGPVDSFLSKNRALIAISYADACKQNRIKNPMHSN